MKIINIKKPGEYKYQFFDENEVQFNIDNNCDIEVLLENTKIKLNFLIQNSNVKINFLNQKKIKLHQNIILKNSYLDINQLNLVIDIKAKTKADLFDSVLNLNSKTYPKNLSDCQTKVIHHTKNSESNLKCLGIGKDNATINFLIKTIIKKNCSNSIANQKTRVIALDDSVIANLEPILKINNHQVTATHAAVFSKITDEEIYYLLTRGLDKDQAKNLIIKSLLTSDNEKYYQKIEEVIG